MVHILRLLVEHAWACPSGVLSFCTSRCASLDCTCAHTHTTFWNGDL